MYRLNSLNADIQLIVDGAWANDVSNRLEPYYEILDFHVEGAMLYFRAKKR